MAKREESFSAVFADSAGECHDESRKGVVDSRVEDVFGLPTSLEGCDNVDV